MRPLLGSILYLLRDPCGVSITTSTSMPGSFGGSCQVRPRHTLATLRSHHGHTALNNGTSVTRRGAPLTRAQPAQDGPGRPFRRGAAPGTGAAYLLRRADPVLVVSGPA